MIINFSAKVQQKIDIRKCHVDFLLSLCLFLFIALYCPIAHCAFLSHHWDNFPRIALASYAGLFIMHFCPIIGTTIPLIPHDGGGRTGSMPNKRQRKASRTKPHRREVIYTYKRHKSVKKLTFLLNV